MRIGHFELTEPVPELNAPHALVCLRPWIDVGNAGTLVLNRLENTLGAVELGSLVRPGSFFDFTRYRPTSVFRQGARHLVIPNTTITCARHQAESDFVFIHLLEPHMFGEVYARSVFSVLQRLGVKRYCLLGSMYDMVPHTRPLLVSGGGGLGEQTARDMGISQSRYQGPTTICNLISQMAVDAGIETATFIVHLPQYTELEEDFMGEVRLLRIVRALYGIEVDEIDQQKAEKQSQELDIAVSRSRKVKEVVQQLEAHYDARAAAQKQGEMPKLSPDIEDFLKEMERRFRQGDL